MRVAGTLIVLTGLTMTSLAMASPPSWSNASHSRNSYRDHDDGDDRYDDDRYDYAPVTHVEPVVRQVRVDTPRRECWDETRTVESRPHISDPAVGGRTLIGAIIGGVVGHQFGSGRGRDAATIAGTVIGGRVGYDSASRAYGGSEERVVQRCSVRHDQQYEERIDGYRVTYEFNGREYTTRLPYDPGRKIRVRVAVAPAE